MVPSHKEAPSAQAEPVKRHHVVMGGDVQGMDYLVALNPTFQELECEVKTEVGICDQGTLENHQNGHVWPRLKLTRLDST